MRRRLFAVVSAISLLACVGTLALWVRSYWQYDEIRLYEGRETQLVQSSAGTIEFSSYSGLVPNWLGPSGWFTYSSPYSLIDNFFGTHFAGFGVSYEGSATFSGYVHPEHPLYGRSWTAAVRRIAAPYWAAVVVTIALPLRWVMLDWQRRKNLDAQHCSSCLYNLTGNTSGVCPECGTPVAKETADKSPRRA